MSDTVILAIIGLIGQIVLGLLVLWNNKLTRETANATGTKIDKTQESLVTLTKSTDGLASRLAKVTGEVEHAKGMEMGARSMNAGKLPGDIGEFIVEARVKAAHSEGVIQGEEDERIKAAAEKTAKLEHPEPPA